MTETFILYLTIHRVLVFAAGILSITLGYRLLLHGLPRGAESGGAQALEARVGNTRIVAKNLAPGSLFALFGAVLVAGMALYRPPEITFDQVDKGGARAQASLRGEERAADRDSETAAVRLLEKGDRGAAGAMAARIGKASAERWNNLAWVLGAAGGNTDVALALAQAAVAADPGSAEYLHTLATVRRQRGENQAALQHMRKAAEIDPGFAPKLKEWDAAPRAK